VAFVRHRRARHYILHVEDDGSVRVTIPRGGSRAEAARFVRQKAEWIERERYRRALRAAAFGAWRAGDRVLFRGEETPLVADPAAGFVTLGPERIPLPAGSTGDLRPLVTAFLRRVAERELPARLRELAETAGHVVPHVSVRNQRSRWGSCSPSGRISLNWRLIQLPPAVRDYVLLHEVTHLREANHSSRFWRHLQALCPRHREARAWLRATSLLT
jgi:predicted metal-dependent hydrolase